jgi:AcrR family transcriptional regulator
VSSVTAPARSGLPTARATRREGRRRNLLRAATTAIRRLGPDASMDAMAAEAGITKPILYRYFGDREGLITAVAECFAEELVTRLEAVVDGPGRPGDRVRGAIDCYVAFIEEDPALYGFFAQHAAVGGPAVQTVVDRVAAVLAASLAGAGLEAGRGKAWAYGIVGMVHLAGARWAASPDTPRARLIDDLTALTRFGLEGSPATRG